MSIENGTYKAGLNGGIVIYQAESGSLCAAIPVRVREGAFAGSDLKHTITLVNKEGEMKENNIATLRTVFGWDTADPFWLADNSLDGGALRDVVFEIVVENEEVVDNFGVAKIVAKIRWLNPEGGGLKMPVMADRRAVLARYGAMFRATAPVVKGGGNAQRSTSNAQLPMGNEEQGARLLPEPAGKGACATAVRPLVLGPKPVAKPAAASGSVATPDEAWRRFVQGYGNAAEAKWREALAALNIAGEPTAADCALLVARVDGDDDVPFDVPAAAVPAATLDAATVGKLEAAIGANGPAAVSWLLGQKWLLPGQGLGHLTAERAGQILARPGRFLAAVKGGEGKS